MRNAFLLVLLVAAGFTGSVAAQSLSEIRAQEAEQQKLAKEAQYTDSVCGTSLTTSIDWRTVVDWPGTVSLAGKCDGALSAVEQICKSAAGKARAKRLTNFVCAGDGAGPSLSGGTLRYGAKPNGAGFAETKPFLESNL